MTLESMLSFFTKSFKVLSNCIFEYLNIFAILLPPNFSPIKV
jgi:hypothetical protein